MYKLMIVDDEQSIRRGMANGIPWGEWGFEVIAQACDGEEALELIKENKPDVVLSDIRMPKMDGVELMKRLNKEYPEIKIIILSGYSDFEYMNTSIKNNVVEYLLKPTDVDEFEETFKRIKSNIDKERIHIDEFEKSKVYYLDSTLNTLLLGYLDEDIMEDDIKLVESFGIHINNCVIAMVNIEWDQTIGDEREKYGERIKIRDCCNDFCDELENTCHFFMSRLDKIIVIMSGETTPINPESGKRDFESVIRKIHDELGYTIQISVGQLCKERRMIPQSYEQALSVAHQRTNGDGKSVITYRDMSLQTKTEHINVNFDFKIIEENIIKNNHDVIFEEIERVFSILEETNSGDYKYVEQICLELLFNLSRWSIEYNINFEQVMELTGVRYEDIRKTVGLDKRKKIILSVIKSLCECIEQCMQHSGKNNNLARIIKACVDEEYMENFMSLEYVASKVKKSAAYVSKLFKDEFGCNFSEYITIKRLETSKKLLSDPSKKIYEIAQMSGYADVSNFIKVFKKKYGISPGDFRNFMQR